MGRSWSAVVPVYNEIELMRRTLPSWFKCNPSELILAVDDPTPEGVEETFWLIAEKYPSVDGRIVKVKKSPEWKFHQANVRRTAFKKAKNDIILTGDIDLVLFKRPILKAINLVGKNNIGLVSLNKFRFPHSVSEFMFTLNEQLLRKLLHGIFDRVMTTTTFTGLYAFYRPYWLETEKEEEIKKLVNPKQVLRGELFREQEISNVVGEDTFLRDAMQTKYRCVYLRDVGAIDLRTGLENLKYIQYHKGAYFACKERKLITALGRAILRFQPYYLIGYLDKKRGVFRGDKLIEN